MRNKWCLAVCVNKTLFAVCEDMSQPLVVAQISQSHRHRESAPILLTRITILTVWDAPLLAFYIKQADYESYCSKST